MSCPSAVSTKQRYHQLVIRHTATVSAYLVGLLVSRFRGSPSCIRKSDSGMAEIVNLRIARKRHRDEAKRRAAPSEQRLAHGVAKPQRNRAAADRDKARQTLDQHRIETGDRR